MGVAFYPAFEDGSGAWADDINGKCLARAADTLDSVARRNGVPTLYDFYSMTRSQLISEILDGDPDDPTTYDDSKVPEEKWYDCNDGLRTVRALLRSTKTINADDLSAIVEDLEAFEKLLADAAERQVRWHLVVDA